MTYETFVKQLDGCTYVSGGFNCNCAAEAMWLYRASQGKTRISACTVRRKTGDRSGGTNLDQMVKVSGLYGIKNGTLWKPGRFGKLVELVATGRYGAIVQIGYSQVRGSPYDCFDGQFSGGHSFYVSSVKSGKAHYADPGADGRRSSIPSGYQDMPLPMLERAASALPLDASGRTLGNEYGSGYVYAYLTPADPVQAILTFDVYIEGQSGVPSTYTPLYKLPNGTFAHNVSEASYVCKRPPKIKGEWWYQIVSKLDGSSTDNAGLWFQPNRYTRAVPR